MVFIHITPTEDPEDLERIISGHLDKNNIPKSTIIIGHERALVDYAHKKIGIHYDITEDSMREELALSQKEYQDKNSDSLSLGHYLHGNLVFVSVVTSPYPNRKNYL